MGLVPRVKRRTERLTCCCGGSELEARTREERVRRRGLAAGAAHGRSRAVAVGRRWEERWSAGARAWRGMAWPAVAVENWIGGRDQWPSRDSTLTIGLPNKKLCRCFLYLGLLRSSKSLWARVGSVYNVGFSASASSSQAPPSRFCFLPP